MKKIIVTVSLALTITLCSILFVFAAYNHSAPPTSPFDWDFTTSHEYTIASKIDCIYTKGTNGFLGIGKKNSSATVKVKAFTNYWSYGTVGIQDADGTFFYYPGPTIQSDTEYVKKQNGSTTNAARFVRYEGETYQMNGSVIINDDYYFYNSQDCVTVHTTS